MRHRVQVGQICRHSRLNDLVPLLMEPLLLCLTSQFSESLLAIEIAEITYKIELSLTFVVLL